MDAEHFLEEAERHLRAGELAEALGAMEKFWAWRREGGAEPFRGADAAGRRMARELRQRLAERQEKEQGPVPLDCCLAEWFKERGPDAGLQRGEQGGRD